MLFCEISNPLNSGRSRRLRMNSSTQIFRLSSESLIPVISSKHSPAVRMIFLLVMYFRITALLYRELTVLKSMSDKAGTFL